MINFIPQQWDDISAPKVAPSISKPEILFQKIEDSVIDVQIHALKKKEVTLEEFQKFVLKTAVVIKAESVKGTENLIKCLVEVGDSEHQIVAGVGQHYKPEELVGKTIVIIENLKPAKIRGVTSQGMLLAAIDGDRIILLTTDKPTSSGASIQ
jgi:methionyl-tRNA synthetase